MNTLRSPVSAFPFVSGSERAPEGDVPGAPMCPSPCTQSLLWREQHDLGCLNTHATHKSVLCFIQTLPWSVSKTRPNPTCMTCGMGRRPGCGGLGLPSPMHASRHPGPLFLTRCSALPCWELGHSGSLYTMKTTDMTNQGTLHPETPSSTTLLVTPSPPSCHQLNCKEALAEHGFRHWDPEEWLPKPRT